MVFDLFKKKTCDICGGKIGMLGNRKLDDGNCCGDCAKQLSPFFSDRRSSSINDIKAQLDYREKNKAAVSAFQVTRTFGITTKVYIDDNAGKFAVSGAKRFGDDNPDIMDLSQITGCVIDIDESQNELKRKDPATNKNVSFNPPRYSYTFTFYIILHVNNQWFNEVKILLAKTGEIEAGAERGTRTGNPGATIGKPGTIVGGIMGGMAGAMSSTDIGRSNRDYVQAEAMSSESKAALTGPRQGMGMGQGAAPAGAATASAATAGTGAGAPQDATMGGDGAPAMTPPAAALAPKNCPHCDAAGPPDAQGNCEFCGGSMRG